MRSINLWSWLIKSDAKSEIYCPPDLKVSLEEFTGELKKKTLENDLPANIEICEVHWDDTDVVQNRILVKYTGKEIKNDIVSFIVGLDSIGSFTYIEEKVVIQRPILPTSKIEAKKSSFLGVIGLVIGLLGLFFSVIMFAMPIYSVLGLLIIVSVIILIINANKNRVRETKIKNWNKAVSDWEKEVLNVAYLSTTNDIFGRFTNAMSSTVKQVIKALYEDRKAELKNRQEKEFSEMQLKEELEKRRNEFN